MVLSTLLLVCSAFATRGLVVTAPNPGKGWQLRSTFDPLHISTSLPDSLHSHMLYDKSSKVISIRYSLWMMIIVVLSPNNILSVLYRVIR